MILGDLFEALKPGEVKGSSVKYIKQVDPMRAAEYDTLLSYSNLLPAGLKEEFKSFVDKFNETMIVGGTNADVTSKSRKKLFNLLESQCSEILNIYEDLILEHRCFLYRGISSNDCGSSTTILHGRPYADRRPLTTKKANHELISRIMSNAGIEARRDNSIFTTSRYNTADSFGRVYIIFPKNGFKYSWTRSEDLIVNQEYISSIQDDKLIKHMFDFYRDMYALFMKKNMLEKI